MAGGVKTGICSYGLSGRVFHAPFINAHPGFELTAIVERHNNDTREKYPHSKLYRSVEELCANKDIQLIIINTPSYLHFEHAKAAILSGKNILVEKPFTITVAEGEELIQLAKERNRIITVYQNRRFDSDYRTVKKIVDEGWLGQIVEAEIHYDRYKEEIGPKLHKETPGPGTGLLYDLGSHLLDQAIQFFGMPESVFADIAIMRKVSKVDDYMELLLFYPGLRVRVKSSYVVREALPSYVFHGTKGSFIKARTDVQEVMLQASVVPGGPEWGVEPDSEKGLLHTEKDGKIIREYIPSLKGNYGDYYDQLYKAIRENAPVPVTAEQGLNIIRIIEAAYESNRDKKVVAVKKK